MSYRSTDANVSVGNCTHNRVAKIYPDLESMRISEMSPYYNYGQNDTVSDFGGSFTSTLATGIHTSVSANNLASALDTQNNHTSILGKSNSNNLPERSTNNNIPTSQSWNNIDSKNTSQVSSVVSSHKNVSMS